MNRRELLLFGATGAALFGTALRVRGNGTVWAATPNTLGAKKLLLVFLRGGNDGVNSVIPGHDAEYTSAIRPSIFIPPAQRLDLGTGGAAFHPSLAKLKEVFDVGECAVLHRVGYPQATLSHFSSQQFWETGKPGDDAFTEGFVARWVDQFGPNQPLPAVSVSDKLQLMFNGSSVIPHVPDLSRYDLGTDLATSKLMGRAPDPSGQGEGLLNRYVTGSGQGAFDQDVRDSGLLMASSLDELASLPPHAPPAAWYPQLDAELAAEGLPQTEWARTFFMNLRDSVRILKQTDCRVAGIQLDGFDHHASQGGVTGEHADHLHTLAHGIRSVRLDTLAGIWNDLAVVCVSEFGRTTVENGSMGTDHGKATAVFAAGGSVRGGVYNCDSATWPSGATLFSDNGKYVAHRTDYRAVLAELFERHMGVPNSSLDLVLPGYSALQHTPEFQYLGYL